jgi:hypothetical protein
VGFDGVGRKNREMFLTGGRHCGETTRGWDVWDWIWQANP